MNSGEQANDGSTDHSRTILIVDDNPLNQKVAKRMVEKIGFESRCVCNGEEAVGAVKSESFAAVLMDCMMPVMDGFEATKQIRQWERGTWGHVPIVALTANALQGQDVKCLAAGMDFFLAKPITIEDLRLALEKLVGGESDLFQFRSPVSQAPRDELLDDDKLRALRQLTEEGRTDFLGEIADIFLEETPEMIADLKEVIDAGDFEMIHRAAQKLRGSCIDLGAKSMGAICAEIMELARRNQSDGDERRVESLVAEYRQIERRFGRSPKILIAS